MYNPLFTRILLLTLLVLQSAVGTAALYTTKYGNGQWPGWPHLEKMFVFGASYTSTGFKWKGTQPSPNNPLGNPSTYQGHTASNGPNFIQYMTRKYNQSLVQTYDFAWAGSPTLGVKDQVLDDFLPNFVPGRKLYPGWNASTTIFPIFVGINDLDHWNTAKVLPVYRNGIFVMYSDALKALYGAGARNFVIYNVPPLDRAPEFRYVSAAKKQEVDNYNARLKSMITYLSTNAKYQNANFWHVDMNRLFNDVIDNKAQFAQTKNYKVLDANCAYYANNWMRLPSMTYLSPECQYPVNEYFWLNGRHVTYPAHDLLAQVTRDALTPSF
ncbi:MAG: hypothetical protein Q9191_005543 [Dirinaria sp. TL-2023a]